MGLDGVELLMEVEDQFGIRIPDEEGGRMRTVADLYYFVLRALDEKENKVDEVCPSRSLFYQVRQVLTETFYVPRHEVRRESRMENLVPFPQRRIAWNRFRAALGISCPDLRRPLWVDGLFRGALPLMLASTIVIPLTGWSWGAWAGAAFLTFIAWVTASIATQPLAVCIPAECATVESTVDYLLAVRRKQIKNGGTAGDVWVAVRHIVSEQLGVAENEIHPELRFVEDLNVG